MASGCQCTSGLSRAHRLLCRGFLLVQLAYKAHSPIDSVRGAPGGLRLELPPPVRVPRVEQYIHADAVLHSQQGSCQSCSATNISMCGVSCFVPSGSCWRKDVFVERQALNNTTSPSAVNTTAVEAQLPDLAMGQANPSCIGIVTRLVLIA